MLVNEFANLAHAVVSSGSCAAEYANNANSRLVSTVRHRYGLKNCRVAINQSKFGTHAGRARAVSATNL